MTARSTQHQFVSKEMSTKKKKQNTYSRMQTQLKSIRGTKRQEKQEEHRI